MPEATRIGREQGPELLWGEPAETMGFVPQLWGQWAMWRQFIQVRGLGIPAFASISGEQHGEGIQGKMAVTQGQNNRNFIAQVCWVRGLESLTVALEGTSRSGPFLCGCPWLLREKGVPWGSTGCSGLGSSGTGAQGTGGLFTSAK